MAVRNRTVCQWILTLMFAVSVYNFLTIALLRTEDLELAEQTQKSRYARSAPENKKQVRGQFENPQLILDKSEEEAPTYVEPKIFWDTEVEESIPKISSDLDSCERFREKVNSLSVKHVEPATWPKCGRPDNAYAELADGTKLCVRYRHPHDYLISGEILSFHLARYFGINVPCVVLSTTGENNMERWPANFTSLNWIENENVALIQWVPDLQTNLQLPKILQKSLETGKPIRYYDIHGKSTKFRATIAQWGSMFLFDYVTGHHDRFARLQDDADKENSSKILKSHVPNLGVDKNGLLWIIDNEPALLDAYELMYRSYMDAEGTHDSSRFRRFQNQTLKMMCIFRKRILLAIIRLYQKEDPLAFFLKMAETHQRKLTSSLKLTEDMRYRKYLKFHFRQRLSDVIAHSKWCADTQEDKNSAENENENI